MFLEEAQYHAPKPQAASEVTPVASIHVHCPPPEKIVDTMQVVIHLPEVASMDDVDLQLSESELKLSAKNADGSKYATSNVVSFMVSFNCCADWECLHSNCCCLNPFF